MLSRLSTLLASGNRPLPNVCRHAERRRCYSCSAEILNLKRNIRRLSLTLNHVCHSRLL